MITAPGISHCLEHRKEEFFHIDKIPPDLPSAFLYAAPTSSPPHDQGFLIKLRKGENPNCPPFRRLGFLSPHSLSFHSLILSLPLRNPFRSPTLIPDLRPMNPVFGADDPLNYHGYKRKPLREMDSEDKEEEIAFFERKSKLLAITWHKRCHELNKLVGLSTSETPLSVIPESILEDSEVVGPLSAELSLDSELPASDLEVLASDSEVPATDLEVHASDSEVPATDLEVPDSDLEVHVSDLEIPASIEASENETLDPDPGFSMTGEATDLGDRANLDDLRQLERDYDETKEFEPVVEWMLRSLLPILFKSVNSFLSNPCQLFGSMEN